MLDTSLERHPLEVLAAEFVERVRQGERPSMTEYTDRYPELAEQILALFPTVVLMEDLKRSRVPRTGWDFPDQGHVPERLGDCRIVREVGRGGMGIVYEAEQESLGRRVAVKVLTAQAVLDAGQLRRFHREAQAMARLHHTNIVPVFGVSTHDGLSYFVMQFIEGRGLDTVIQEQRLEEKSQPLLPHLQLTPTQVARIGVQVADALEYAHRQDILHRDIKPSNLLIDHCGTSWVTDFGLAKLVEQDDAMRPSETVGTLRYMAPERFRGQSDARSDVYSLGLTLYEMLTLRPAFDESDRARLIHQVTQEEAPAPRKCNTAIPRDLETVVLRAMARDPDQRYQSAGELAEDLRRFLEDKPVLARRVGLGERLWRWCRRNPAVASLTALAASLLVLVAVSTSVGYVQTREALRREMEQRQEAIGQRQRAEANLTLALRAFEEISVQVARRPASRSPDLGDESAPAGPPVVSPEVAALLNNLLKFYDRFGESNHAEPRLQREIARAYQRVGDLQERLGQFEKAETAYRRALALYEEQASASPGEADCTYQTASIQNELGLVLQATGRYVEAEQAYRQALKTLRAQVQQAPDCVSCRFELARAHTLLGSVLAMTGKVAEVEENQRGALRLLAQLRKEDPDNAEYRLAQARGYQHLSFALGMKGRYHESAADVGKAASLLEKLAKDFPAIPDYRYELAEVLIHLPTSGWGPERNERMEQQLHRAVDLARELAVAYPAVPQYQALRARALQKLGFFYQMSWRSDEAEKFYRDAVTLQRALVDQFPAVPFYQLFRAEACESLGRSLLRRGELAEACALMEEAINAQQTFVKATPGNRFGRMQLANEYQTLAEALRRHGDAVQSQEASRRAEEVKRGR
jgi:eukaryotic-like serine/threonine-protein kinase